MAKKICKGHSEYEDVAHFAITEFMTHERGQELVDTGRGMNFLSGIMWRSFNSSTSQYHTVYRQKGRMHSLPETHLSTLLQMWLENPNYSELSRRTGIPRNSISNAIEEAKKYIREQLKLQNINYEL